ncbi:MAG: glycoside-pentoside-hexuronide (GPH):cation symporter, partial [Oscillospiraceae bacterium]
KIRFSEKLGFGAFSTASNVVYQFKNLYYLFFLTNVLKINVAAAGLILTIGTIWDAVNDPLLGFWSVNHKFKNGERCRPFALWFALPWAGTVVLLFSDFNVSERAAVVIAMLIYIVFELFNTFVGIPYNSMGGLATNVDSERRSINVYRNLGGCLGSGIGAVGCLPLLNFFGALDEKGNLIDAHSSRGFLYAAIVMGVVCLIGCFIHYFTTKERVKPLANAEEKLKVAEVVKMLFHCKSWIMNTLYIICYGVISLMLMSCINYYATYIVGSTASATIVMAVYLVASIVATLLVAPIDKLLGRKRTMIFGALLFIAGKIWFIFDPYAIGALYVNAITVGMAVSITFVMFNTNRNNIVDLIEWNDGRRLDSIVSTADNLASKLATAGATLMITSALSFNGFDAELEVLPAAAVNTINAFLGWVPMLIAVVMLVIVCYLNIDKDMKKMNDEKKQGVPERT